MLDTVLAAIGGAVVAATAVGAVLKSVFDRTLDSRFKAAEEKFKAQFGEQMRRQGKIFDAQIEPLLSLTNLIYRARNVARELITNRISTIQKINEFESLHIEFSNKFQDSRGLLPLDVFYTLHESTKAFKIFREVLQKRYSVMPIDKENAPPQQVEKYQRQMNEAFHELDIQYSAVLEEIQEYLGIFNAR